MPLNLVGLAAAHSVACPRPPLFLVRKKGQAHGTLKIAEGEIGLLNPVQK